MPAGTAQVIAIANVDPGATNLDFKMPATPVLVMLAFISGSPTGIFTAGTLQILVNGMAVTPTVSIIDTFVSGFALVLNGRVNLVSCGTGLIGSVAALGPCVVTDIPPEATVSIQLAGMAFAAGNARLTVTAPA